MEVSFMRGLWRSGPLLLALGVAWTGCSQSGEGPYQPGARPVARKTDQAKPATNSKQQAEDKTAAVMIPAGTECVLSVEGMA
jgi:hypothetical protein